jgi:hypothetical protein
MCTKVWFVTGMPCSTRAETAKAALVDDKQVVATGRSPEAVTGALTILATLLPIQGKSRNFRTTALTWLRDLLTPPTIRAVKTRCLPGVIFTPSGPLVYQWRPNRSER